MIEKIIEDIKNQDNSSHLSKVGSFIQPKEEKPKQKTDAEYLNMKDPKTGLAYNIPFLNFLDPDYAKKYIEFMKLKEKNPDQFKKILNWG